MKWRLGFVLRGAPQPCVSIARRLGMRDASSVAMTMTITIPMTLKVIRRFLVSCGLVVLASGGCADSKDGAIDYQLTGGFIGLHASVHIDPDGKLSGTKQNGSAVTGQLDAAALAELRGKVDQAQFSTLQPMYDCNCADDLLHTITVDVDGTEYTVKADGTADYPDRLKPLIDALEEMTSVPFSAQ
ncbi:MAG TPA: hypothetical protein VLM79_38620 [Kofleriaceae bacterium]|nr:hypothetical protein [Kofleriaceae bacterium]